MADFLPQASHLASLNGWPIPDPTDVSCMIFPSLQINEINVGKMPRNILTTLFSAVSFETWHLELIAGLVIVISSSRYILLQTWPDFRDSSEAANTQVCNYVYPLELSFELSLLLGLLVSHFDMLVRNIILMRSILLNTERYSCSTNCMV